MDQSHPSAGAALPGGLGAPSSAPAAQGRRHDFHRANAFRRARRSFVLVGLSCWLGRGLDRGRKPGFAPGVGGGHGGRIGRCGFDTRLGCFGVRHTFYWRRLACPRCRVAGCVVGSVFGVCVCGLNAQHHFVLHAFTGGLTWAIATAAAVGSPRPAPAVLWRTHVGSRRGRGMPGPMAHGLARFQCSILNLRRESPSTQNAEVDFRTGAYAERAQKDVSAHGRERGRPPRAGADRRRRRRILCWPRRGSFGLRLRLGVCSAGIHGTTPVLLGWQRRRCRWSCARKCPARKAGVGFQK